MEEEVRRPICKMLNDVEAEALYNLLKLCAEGRWPEFWEAVEHVDRLVSLSRKVCGGA